MQLDSPEMKKEMAQFLPIVIQLINNPTFVQNCSDNGWEFDAPAVFQSFCDAAGFKFSQNFLKKMSPERQQEHKANSPAALQANQLKAQQAMQVQKFQHDEQQEGQKQLGKAAGEQLRLATEHSLAAEENPPGETFGSTTAL